MEGSSTLNALTRNQRTAYLWFVKAGAHVLKASDFFITGREVKLRNVDKMVVKDGRRPS